MKRVRRNERSKTEQLKAKATRLRVDFAQTDLATAMTFVRLARFYIRTEQPERATKLLREAQHAASTIDRIVAKLSGEVAKTLKEKLALLADAIDEAKEQSEA